MQQKTHGVEAQIYSGQLEKQGTGNGNGNLYESCMPTQGSLIQDHLGLTVILFMNTARDNSGGTHGDQECNNHHSHQIVLRQVANS